MKIYHGTDVPRFFVSDDKEILDVPFIFQELKTSYFGSWREMNTVQRSIHHSLCFGLYQVDFEGGIKQIGFARVVTDYSTFAWICDVLVTRARQGQGLGKFLMQCVMGHPEVKPRSCLLSTHDAHGLYAQFGFKQFSAMKRLPLKE